MGVGNVQLSAEAKMKDFLGRYSKEITGVVPAHMTTKKMLWLICGEFQRTPGLLNCTPGSVLNAVLTAASLGIEIRPNSAYLVPFKTKKGMIAQLMIDYRSKIDLARRSGFVDDIEANLVYTHDEWDYVTTLAKTDLRHRQLKSRQVDGKLMRVTLKERGEVILGYALARLVNGGTHGEVMTYEEIEAIRERSKAKDDGPWKTDWPEMARKTLVHRICKYLPQSPELQRSQDVDTALETGTALAPMITITPTDMNAGPIADQPDQQPSTPPKKQKAPSAKPQQRASEQDAPPPPTDEQPADEESEPTTQAGSTIQFPSFR